MRMIKELNDINSIIFFETVCLRDDYDDFDDDDDTRNFPVCVFSIFDIVLYFLSRYYALLKYVKSRCKISFGPF